MKRTYQAKKEEIDAKWYVVDADGKVLGRLAAKLATVLRGKNKPIFTPHVDTGDFVVVVNAKKVVLTGKKLQDKTYYHYTGYPGGIRETSAEKMMAKKPTEVLRLAVKGMLPKNTLGRQMLRKLKVYAGPRAPRSTEDGAGFLQRRRTWQNESMRQGKGRVPSHGYGWRQGRGSS
jgi:large subunit ribosomal protein L13